MKILILNQDWFAAELRKLGHEVWTIGIGTSHLDHNLNHPFLHIDTLISGCLNDQRPDAIVVHDNSSPLGFIGLDDTTIPTLFYSVDAHHHTPFHKHLGLIFDAVLVAQRDYLPEFQALDPAAQWLPLWASRYVEPAAEKRYPVSFVGTLDPKLNPDRVRFFNELQSLVPIHIHSGQWWPIFASSEIVVNQTVKGDINFRVFEAMMSGACLLTERSSNGLLDLFHDGQHLVTYKKGSSSEAAAQIDALLNDPAKLRQIAASGRAEIMRAHLPIHRATVLADILKALKKRRLPGGRFGYMANFALLGQRLLKINQQSAIHSLLHALRIGETAVTLQGTLLPEIANYLVIASHHYDSLTNSMAGSDLLDRAAPLYPHCPILTLAQIRSRLNRGDLRGAEAISRRLSNDPPTRLFGQSEEIIASLLGAADGI